MIVSATFLAQFNRKTLHLCDPRGTCFVRTFAMLFFIHNFWNKSSECKFRHISSSNIGRNGSIIGFQKSPKKNMNLDFIVNS